DAPSQTLVSGVAEELSERLGRVQRGGHGMTLIPPAEALRNHVETPEAARSMLGATHTLQADFRDMDGKVLAHADVRDAQTRQIVQSFSAEYASAEVAPLLAKALLGTVMAGLRESGVTIPETVNGAAYADYVQGLHYLQDDAHQANRAIPFLERAAKLDQRSALPYAGIVESEVLMFVTSKNRQWLARAEESLKNAVARNPDAL